MSGGRRLPGAGLSATVMRGGRLLAMRQVAGMVLSLVGMLFLTRLIGPMAYGTYAAAFGIVFFLQTMSEYSLDVYLVRYPGELPADVSHQVFTFLVGSGLAMTGASLLGLLVAGYFIDVAVAAPVFVALVAGLTIVNLQQVPLSLLERELNYNSIGLIEIVGQLGFFAVALAVAVVHPTAWAPVFGWLAQQIVLLVGYWSRAGYRPRMVWQPGIIRPMLAFGSAAISSTFMGSFRSLANPVLVGGFVGATAVGYVALALRLLEQASFMRTIAYRLSIAVVSKVIDDANRLRRVLTLGSEMQLAAVAIPVTALSLAGGTFIPIFFGPDWRPVAEIIPILVPVYLATAAFILQYSVLIAQTRPWDLTLSVGANAALIWGAGLLLIPRFGIYGYAASELIGTASWLLTDYFLARQQRRPHYATILLWWGAFSIGGLAPLTTWWLVLVPIIAVFFPASRGSARNLYGFVMGKA